MKGVFAELVEIHRPALRSRRYGLYRVCDNAFKINRRSGAALSIPFQGSQKFLLGFGVKSYSLICHEEEFVLSAELLPKEW